MSTDELMTVLDEMNARYLTMMAAVPDAGVLERTLTKIAGRLSRRRWAVAEERLNSSL